MAVGSDDKQQEHADAENDAEQLRLQRDVDGVIDRWREAQP